MSWWYLSFPRHYAVEIKPFFYYFLPSLISHSEISLFRGWSLQCVASSFFCLPFLSSFWGIYLVNIYPALSFTWLFLLPLFELCTSGESSAIFVLDWKQWGLGVGVQGCHHYHLGLSSWEPGRGGGETGSSPFSIQTFPYSFCFRNSGSENCSRE